MIPSIPLKFSNDLPMIVPIFGSYDVLAKPLPADTIMSPFVTLPRTLTGTRPCNAINAINSPGHVEFNTYAGAEDTTPATFIVSSDANVTSLFPPNSKTVPA